MKVLNVSETTVGGISTYFDSIAKSNSVDNDFLAFDYPASIYKLDKINRVVNTLVLLWYLLIKIDLSSYNYIFLHSSFAGFLRPFLYVFLFRKKTKIIYCSHGWSFNVYCYNPYKRIFLRLFYILIERLLSYFSHRIVCISDSDYKTASEIGIAEKRMAVVWNGVRESSYKQGEICKNHYAINVLYVGRLDIVKGIKQLLLALQSIDESLENRIVLTIVGDSFRDEKDELTSLLQYSYQNIDLCHKGWVDNNDIDVLYSCTDFLIVPSLWEGFGLVVAEAFRNGVPVLSSNVGSLPDMVNKKVGWVYDVDNSEDLNSTLIHIINNKSFIDIDSADCISLFRSRFHEDAMNNSYYNLFCSV